MRDQFTLGQWADLTDYPQTSIHFSLITCETYDDFADAVESCVSLVIHNMQENPELRQGRKEDEISIEIITNLRNYPLHVEHESKVGGHTDFLIRGRGYTWIAEAKHDKRGDAWIMSGYEQLVDKYTSPTVNSSRGAMIVYSYKPRLDEVMEKWRAYFEKHRTTATTSDMHQDRVTFHSDEPHPRNGISYSVRHLGMSLYWHKSAEAGR